MPELTMARGSRRRKPPIRPPSPMNDIEDEADDAWSAVTQHTAFQPMPIPDMDPMSLGGLTLPPLESGVKRRPPNH